MDTMALGQAEDLVARLHYAGGGANTATFRHGLYRKTEWPLYPVGAAWWIPPTRSAAEATWPDWTRVLALSRLVLDPDVPKNGASFLLARSVRLVERSGEWDCLVTYADEWQGHTGAIYRAAGWEYVGLTKPERVYVIGGRMVARKAGPVTRTHAEMLALGAECVGAFSKHKFRKVIGRREHHARASGRYCRVCGWYHDGPRCKPYREEGRADPGVLPQPPAPGPHPGGSAGDPPRAAAPGGTLGSPGAVAPVSEATCEPSVLRRSDVHSRLRGSVGRSEPALLGRTANGLGLHADLRAGTAGALWDGGQLDASGSDPHGHPGNRVGAGMVAVAEYRALLRVAVTGVQAVVTA